MLSILQTAVRKPAYVLYYTNQLVNSCSGGYRTLTSFTGKKTCAHFWVCTRETVLIWNCIADTCTKNNMVKQFIQLQVDSIAKTSRHIWYKYNFKK